MHDSGAIVFHEMTNLSPKSGFTQCNRGIDTHLYMIGGISDTTEHEKIVPNNPTPRELAATRHGADQEDDPVALTGRGRHTGVRDRLMRANPALSRSCESLQDLTSVVEIVNPTAQWQATPASRRGGAERGENFSSKASDRRSRLLRRTCTTNALTQTTQDCAGSFIERESDTETQSYEINAA